jgi:two-component system, sensor histidine kinase and response regulator
MLNKRKITKSHKILIVDDHKDNLFILSRVLSDTSYEKLYAEDGVKALEIAQKELPDLILLDIMLPQLDGYQVCQRLKDNPETRDIPVIFITVKVQEEDILKGFDIGGVDYITKPFKYEELIRRVDTHLQLKDSKELIEEQNAALQEFIFNRNSLMASAVSILKNPIHIISGYAKIISKNAATIKPKDIRSMMEEIQVSGDLMTNFIEKASIMNDIENGELHYIKSEFVIDELIGEIINNYSEMIERKKIQLQVISEKSNFIIYSDYEKMKIILDNLVSNALIFVPHEALVEITTFIMKKNQREYLCITVSDNGPGFTKEDKEHIFKKYTKLSNPPISHEESGCLGLAITRDLSYMIDGKLSIESARGKGSAFTLTIPTD